MTFTYSLIFIIFYIFNILIDYIFSDFIIEAKMCSWLNYLHHLASGQISRYRLNFRTRLANNGASSEGAVVVDGRADRWDRRHAKISPAGRLIHNGVADTLVKQL